MNYAPPTTYNDHNWIWRATFTAFFLLSLLVFLLQQNDFNNTAARGLIIPDVVNITNTLDILWESDTLLQTDNQFVALSLLYGWTWLLHPSLCFLINTALVTSSMSVFKKISAQSTTASKLMAIGVLANPYLILAMPGPNKEIPLLFLTAHYASAILNRRKGWPIYAAILCGFIFWIRDGYGAFLMLCLLAVIALRHREQLFTPVICVLIAITASMYGPLQPIIPVLSRNSEVYEFISENQTATGLIASAFSLNPYSPIDGAILFGLRLLYNLVSLALFPVTHTIENHIYWIGLAYWIYGVAILSTISTITFNTLNRKTKSGRQMLVSGLVIGTWFMTSLSLFVQPRYLMPVLPFAFLALYLIPKKRRRLGASISLLLIAGVIATYAGLGRSPPPASPEQFEVPAYIWRR